MTKQVGQDASSALGLTAELRRLFRLVSADASRHLDGSFELSSSAAGRRRLQALFWGMLFFVVAFGLHALLRWKTGAMSVPGSNVNVLAPDSLLIGWRIFLVLGISSSLALNFAGQFIRDIFELKDPSVAWTFIGRLAGGARTEVLHLREGRLGDNDRKSPIIQIGGPGRIIVDYDTAALFERPDGTPHVVGATDGGTSRADKGQTVVELEGFERLREPVISLRDQYIGNPAGQPLTVVGRSLDGLPISVTDVRGVFSVRREGRAAGTQAPVERPFPFRARDIENLIYKQPVAVLTSGEYASDAPGEWTAVMDTLIRESLEEFMSRNRLAEFLAGVGPDEAERSEFRADTILSRTLQVSSEAPPPSLLGGSSPPRFRPRTELSAKFRKYGSEFSTRAQEQGLELHWIGVGTWKMPDEESEDAVTAKHIEAWRLNRENAARLQSQALERVTEEALLEHKLRMIREIPLARHTRNRARYADKSVLMECLLQDFWEQLGDALDVHYRSGTPSTDLDKLEQAVAKVEQLLSISQMGQVLGGTTMSRIRKREAWDRTLERPPAPASKAEALQYQALLSRLKGDFRVAEAMIANENRRHGDLTREQLISRIVERFERHGRESGNG